MEEIEERKRLERNEIGEKRKMLLLLLSRSNPFWWWIMFQEQTTIFQCWAQFFLSSSYSASSSLFSLSSFFSSLLSLSDPHKVEGKRNRERREEGERVGTGGMETILYPGMNVSLFPNTLLSLSILLFPSLLLSSLFLYFLPSFSFFSPEL